MSEEACRRRMAARRPQHGCESIRKAALPADTCAARRAGDRDCSFAIGAQDENAAGVQTCECFAVRMAVRVLPAARKHDDAWCARIQKRITVRCSAAVMPAFEDPRPQRFCRRCGQERLLPRFFEISGEKRGQRIGTPTSDEREIIFFAARRWAGIGPGARHLQYAVEERSAMRRQRRSDAKYARRIGE